MILSCITAAQVLDKDIAAAAAPAVGAVGGGGGGWDASAAVLPVGTSAALAVAVDDHSSGDASVLPSIKILPSSLFFRLYFKLVY